MIYLNRELYLDIEKDTEFKELVTHYHEFKNPFLVQFGEEFKKHTIDELTPTLLLVLEEKNKELIQEFTTIAEKYKNNMHSSIVILNEMNTGQKILFKEVD